jgi:hypothetical protein
MDSFFGHRIVRDFAMLLQGNALNCFYNKRLCEVNGVYALQEAAFPARAGDPVQSGLSQ